MEQLDTSDFSKAKSKFVFFSVFLIILSIFKNEISQIKVSDIPINLFLKNKYFNLICLIALFYYFISFIFLFLTSRISQIDEETKAEQKILTAWNKIRVELLRAEKIIDISQKNYGFLARYSEEVIPNWIAAIAKIKEQQIDPTSRIHPIYDMIDGSTREFTSVLNDCKNNNDITETTIKKIHEVYAEIEKNNSFRGILISVIYWRAYFWDLIVPVAIATLGFLYSQNFLSL